MTPPTDLSADYNPYRSNYRISTLSTTLVTLHLFNTFNIFEYDLLLCTCIIITCIIIVYTWFGMRIDFLCLVWITRFQYLEVLDAYPVVIKLQLQLHYFSSSLIIESIIIKTILVLIRAANCLWRSNFSLERFALIAP